jgi:hypothetical protein
VTDPELIEKLERQLEKEKPFQIEDTEGIFKSTKPSPED